MRVPHNEPWFSIDEFHEGLKELARLFSLPLAEIHRWVDEDHIPSPYAEIMEEGMLQSVRREIEARGGRPVAIKTTDWTEFWLEFSEETKSASGGLQEPNCALFGAVDKSNEIGASL